MTGWGLGIAVRRARRRAVVLVFVLCCVASGAWAESIDLQVYRDDDRLLSDWDVQSVLSRDVVESVRSGLPALVRVRLELWRQRSTLWDQLVLERQLEFRVLYDLLDERFEVIDEGGDRLLSTDSLEELHELLGGEQAFPLCALEELSENRRYYLVMDLRIEPLSLEEIRDLERWLRGSLGSSGRDKRAVGAFPRQLFGVLKSRVGLGERRRTERGEVFRLRELSRVDD